MLLLGAGVAKFSYDFGLIDFTVRPIEQEVILVGDRLHRPVIFGPT